VPAQCAIHHPRRGECLKLTPRPDGKYFFAASGCVDKNTRVWGVLLDHTNTVICRGVPIATPGGGVGFWLMSFTLDALDASKRYRLEVRDFDTGELLASSEAICIEPAGYDLYINSPASNGVVGSNFAAYGISTDTTNPISGSINGTGSQPGQNPPSWVLYFQAVTPGTNLTLNVQQGVASQTRTGLTVR
jgi:hypothetical protein